MTPTLFILVAIGTLVAPRFTIVLVGLLVHHGIWSLEWAVPTLWVLWTLRYLTVSPQKEKRRWFGPFALLGFTLALLALGLYSAHVIHDLIPSWLRWVLGVLSLVFGFFWLSQIDVWCPKRWRWVLRRVPHPGKLPQGTRRVGAALLVLPFWPSEPVDLDRALELAFTERGLVAQIDQKKVSAEKLRGVRAIFGATRVLVPAKKAGDPADIYLARVMFNYEGRPVRVTGIFNLTDTGSVEEGGLELDGRWGAWAIRSGGRLRTIEVADLRGEEWPSGPGWGIVGRVQRRITNLQQVGQSRGVGRYSVSVPEVVSEPEYRLEVGVLEVRRADGEPLHWALGREAPAELAELGYAVRELPPPRSGDLTTWAVDRLREVSFIGPEGMQWIKGVVFRASAKLEDLHADVVGVNAEEAISEELGGVLERLPIATESAIPDWPPAPVLPRLKPALPAEGEWVDLGRDLLSADSQGGPGALLFTFIRVDPKRSYNQVSIVLWDPRRIELHIVAGTEEPRSTLGQQGKGLISRDPKVLNRVVAAFNGAFQAVHGEFGMMEDRVLQLPPKPYAATIATFEDGSTGFGTWPAVPTTLPPEMVGLRQNMTPLVADSKPNPYGRRWWGGVPEGWTEEARTVRSALCLTKEAYIAYFYSPSVDPDRLAQAMLSARCSYGVHLDMNAGHAGFEFYRVELTEALPNLGRALDPAWEATGKVSGAETYSFLARLMVRKMPLMNFPRYIHQTPRDFFYLTRRDLLPGPDLRLESPLSAEPFGNVDTPTNTYPPFAVTTPISDGARSSPVVRMVRLDPRQLRASGSFAEQAVLFPGEWTSGVRQEGAGKGLYFGPLGFSITSAPSLANGVALAFESSGMGRPRRILCLEPPGFLAVLEIDRQASSETVESVVRGLQCQETLTLSSESSLEFPSRSEGDGAEEAPRTGAQGRSLFRRSGGLARQIFPETPIVAEKIWGLPQARRVEFDAP